MGLLDTLGVTRDAGRLQELLGILVRYGFHEFVEHTGLQRVFHREGAFTDKGESIDLENRTAPERARDALQEMGPTFIKLGQILATRIDLFDADWICAFESLHDNVVAVPFEQLAPTLERQFGGPVSEYFDDVDHTPLAVGSIAQVHRATLQGDTVVLKIQRPGIRKSIEADLRLMAVLVHWVDSEFSALKRYAPRQIHQQFSSAMRRELDFSRECRASDRIRDAFQDINYVVIPKVYWDYTGPEVCVQEYLSGVSIGQVGQLPGVDPHTLAVRGVEAFIKMALDDGFFHADPHPGNMFFMTGNRIALIDFGLVGSLSEHRRGQLALLLYGAAESDANPIVDVMIDWAGNDAAIDRAGLAVDVEGLLNEYRGVSLSQVDMSVVLLQLTSLARNYNLGVPPDLTLLIKAVMVLETLALRLDPDFDLVKEAEPFVRRAILHRYSADSLLHRGRHALAEMAGFLGDFPNDLRRLVMAVRRGKVPIDIQVEQLDDFGRRIERAVNRGVIGLVVAALIVGSSIVMTSNRSNGFFDVSIFGFVGFVFASLAGVWLLFSMWHWRK